MNTTDAIQAIMSDEDGLTLEQLCSICAVTPSWVSLRIEEGLIDIPEGEPSYWRFNLSTTAARGPHAPAGT